MQTKRMVFLASDCESSRWVYHALSGDFEFAAVIIEQPVSKRALFRSRLKRYPLFKVLGQAMFSALVVPFLNMGSKQRKTELVSAYGLNNAGFDQVGLRRVSSVNDDEVKSMLQQLQPDIIVVNGTRIISKKILESTRAIFINMHAGITPWYRGSHGGYWALYNNDAVNFGTTIHLVDTGVDTGAVLKQVFARPGREDNFATYPILQTAIGIQALKDVLHLVMAGNYETNNHTEKGRMYHQPTIWQYFSGKRRSRKSLLS